MLIHAPFQIIGNTGIEDRVAAIGDHVNPIMIHAHTLSYRIANTQS